MPGNISTEAFRQPLNGFSRSSTMRKRIACDRVQRITAKRPNLARGGSISSATSTESRNEPITSCCLRVARLTTDYGPPRGRETFASRLRLLPLTPGVVFWRFFSYKCRKKSDSESPSAAAARSYCKRSDSRHRNRINADRARFAGTTGRPGFRFGFGFAFMSRILTSHRINATQQNFAGAIDYGGCCGTNKNV